MHNMPAHYITVIFDLMYMLRYRICLAKVVVSLHNMASDLYYTSTWAGLPTMSHIDIVLIRKYAHSCYLCATVLIYVHCIGFLPLYHGCINLTNQVAV